ncbi:YegS/Rv2252/BmrU family lipid kinase [Spiractinospora alimapuensis]|uniref:diacylglycerol/lipid kinase family protein n=1 Tax=Spiractinospora alimapuensis TaxID=2820884 RepID=UPI001F18BFD6|nr:YegS/Rv2252/BmrU family lipid kinase [Spiractinospora alimapuensis]QVQ51500.1 YegS/Rv2252/BmrU family lipid kinase [Spiractinospora alimapuensis]
MLIITNSDAGGTRDDKVKTVAAELDHADIAQTATPGDLDAALDHGHDTVVAAGGDGSLHALANALYRRGELGQRTVGLIPMGTGNDFARTLGLPSDPIDAARALMASSPRRLDVIVDDTGEVTVNAVHLGASAEATVAAAAYKKALGPLGYPLGTLTAGVRTSGHRMRIAADGRLVVPNRRVLMVALANGRFIGGGAELSPGSHLDDGTIDLIISRSMRLTRRARYAMALARGSHIAEHDVFHHRARQVTIYTTPATSSSDGETTEGVTHRSWTARPGAWNFLVPPGSSRA